MTERRKFTDTFGLGDTVAIVREAHGWHDGRVTGTIETISAYECTVVADKNDTTFSGATFTIPRPRDIHLISKAKSGSHRKNK